MSEFIKKIESEEELLRSDLERVFDGVRYLTPMERGFIHELAKAVAERKKEDLASLAIQNSIASKVHTTNLDRHLRNAEYNGPGFYAAVMSFAKANGYEVFPRGQMANCPVAGNPQEYLKRVVIGSDGAVEFYLHLNQEDKKIYVYNFITGFFVGSPIDMLVK
ncbi:MAG: hypothetical protein RBS56_02520 [Candidatus Gracilibacteria bacterium]|jgi:hypothetical protein|nr:hypothetical protein [Candidatus Gracilibacteria bacterium]